MTRIGIALGLLAMMALGGESLTLTLADGKKKSVTLQSFDDEGLVATQSGKPVTLRWTELAPASAHEARKRLIDLYDGAARLALAEFALRLQLFPEAREDLEIALALGGLDEAAFEKRSLEITRLEVAHLSARIDRLVKEKAGAAATLAAIKRLKERYPEHAANAKYEPLIQPLVEQLAEQAEAELSAQERKSQDKALAALQKQVAKLLRRKDDALAKGDALRREADEAIAKRQVSRVKRKLVEPMGAERYYKRARKYLREIARKDRQGQIVPTAELQKEYESIVPKLIDCYLNVARILLKERNYKGAVEYVRKVLLYDPIHEEALEMVEEIRKNRITFKLSDITNARPRVTGG